MAPSIFVVEEVTWAEDRYRQVKTLERFTERGDVVEFFHDYRILDSRHDEWSVEKDSEGPIIRKATVGDSRKDTKVRVREVTVHESYEPRRLEE